MNPVQGTSQFNESVSLLSDPFQKQCVRTVRLTWTRYSWDMNNPRIYANIEFVNGNTNGEHKIEARSMDELIIKTKAFLDTLQK